MDFTYQTEHLILRVLTSDNAQLVLNFYTENNIFFEQWEPDRSVNFYTESYQRTILTAEYNQIFQKKSVRFYAFLKENPDTIIGTFSFNNLNYHVFQNCSIGYKIHSAYLRKGYASEMLHTALWIAFHELNLHKVEALVHSENIPSQNLLKKLHFFLEGTSIDAVLLKGTWQNHLRYVFLSDWYPINE